MRTCAPLNTRNLRGVTYRLEDELQHKYARAHLYYSAENTALVESSFKFPSGRKVAMHRQLCLLTD